ncbi:NAD(P)-dependent alcohol dehydrogenase [Micromonospora endophytica]|uniref:Alcohol dehydrogenase n=1 Tax=Micromonospora endophytica TaxID=515350 RepID=A0A2W2E5K8_9ACTN|nr:NAD(P)-dependent alcohol dehydrogenase [Micromonospora endophytica]PZG00184.1 alcohol dehydrogenase [Micromonospora endophytica]RIW47972.1 NAD(P)-dependent alcohol dehydrogenase [Micromonospora endophytica]
MRAAVTDRYGAPEVVRVAEVARPRPRTGQVLVRVRAAAVTSADSRIRGARFPAGFGVPARLMFGVRRPRRGILGGSFSGVVDQLGPGVGGLAPGDEVCGMTGVALGAHAEYVAVRADRLARKPTQVTHEQAAGLLFGGSTALFFLRDKANVGPGTSVLVNGASGAIGTNAVQLARHLGATVTAVTSTANHALASRLGAERVIDYADGGLAASTERFDVVLDAVGNLSIDSGRRLLRTGGRLLLVVASLGQTIRARGDVVAGAAPERVADFEFLLRLVARDEITVVLDQAHDLDGIVEAHRRVDTGHKVGNIVVRP